MTRARIRVFLDENVPVEVKEWLQERKSLWEVSHVYDVGLESRPDSEVFAWAQANRCLVITYDKTFANGWNYTVGRHYGLTTATSHYPPATSHHARSPHDHFAADRPNAG